MFQQLADKGIEYIYFYLLLTLTLLLIPIRAVGEPAGDPEATSADRTGLSAGGVFRLGFRLGDHSSLLARFMIRGILAPVGTACGICKTCEQGFAGMSFGVEF